MGRGGAARLGDAAGLIPHGTGCGQRPMQDGILTVRALTEQLRRSLEGRFPFVWVRGEVSNLSRPGSGHIYFSLKDQDAQLQCVWFRGQQRQAEQGQAFDPLTGEVFDTPRPSPLELLRNGLDLLCAGRGSRSGNHPGLGRDQCPGLGPGYCADPGRRLAGRSLVLQ